MTQPHLSPTRSFGGCSRRLEQELDGRLRMFLDGQRAIAIADALLANARAMDLDRSNYTAIMGMELLAEDFENWAAAPDWKACAERGSAEIEATESLYRGRYVRFLEEASQDSPPVRKFISPLQEIASGWDELAASLKETAAKAEPEFGRAARLIRRLALLEENFWGRIIDQSERLLV